ncbi:MAG TPA: nitronate monooxygenase family protein [Acidimicrobiales bacterium]|nr:nitronate monooxygenase family protein [Acidimicrobiales bacterium]
MLQTPLCSLVGISVPVIQGPLGGPWPPSVRLAAAVSGAGALGSLLTALRSAAQVREDIAAVRELTDRPYAVNHTMRPFVEEVFAEILRAAPPVVSFALGCRPDLVARVHDAGSLFVQQVHTAAQAAQAVEAGADVVIAQGGEAGGFGGPCSTMVLVPQVVDEVAPVPVVAAGGIADGRGLAAALALGAQGANVGTRFIASDEAQLSDGYKKAVLATRSDQTLRAAFVNDLVPPASEGAYATAPRVVRNSFIDEWHGREDEARRMKGQLVERMRTAMGDGTVHELLVITGEVAGAIDEVLPAAEIVRRMAAGAEEVLRALNSV